MTSERIDVMRAAARDGCEWNPDNDSPAYDNDEHYLNTSATVIVGADGQWRLCDSCASLPGFKRFRTRKQIKTNSADSGTGTPEAETAGSEPERSPATGSEERIRRMTDDRLEELEYHAASQQMWEDWGKLDEALQEIRRQRICIEKALRWCDVAEQNGCDGAYFKEIRRDLS